jgi:putative component of toxin-antitoxin plasmid stabilization module
MSWQVTFLNEKKFEKLLHKFRPPTRNLIAKRVVGSLTEYGAGVATTDSGRALGGGLFEFKLDMPPEVLLRVFFVVRGNSVIVILSAYDKKANDSRTWQNRQILAARKLLKVLDAK